MGGHYDSLHFKTADRELVVSVAEDFCGARRVRMLISPIRNGWVSVYSERDAWEMDPATELTKRVPGYAVHFNIYHDDILFYTLFESGGVIDEYDSNPLYFGGSNTQGVELVGTPERFAPLIGPRTVELASVIKRDLEEYRSGEYDRLEKIGQILGIRNAVSSYEYLMGGETEGIVGWSKFIEVPRAVVAAKAKEKSKERASATSKRNLQMKRGELLYHKEHKVGATQAHVLGAGFLIGRCKHWSVPELGVLFPPWKSVRELHFENLVADHNPRISTYDNRLALTCENGVAIWEYRDGTFHRVAFIERGKHILHVSFAAEGKHLVLLIRTLTGTDLREVVDIETSSLLSSERSTNEIVATHPSGQHIVRSGEVLEFSMKTEALKWARLPILDLPRRGPDGILRSGRMGISFTPKGDFLIVRGAGGLRFYNWQELLNGTDDNAVITLVNPPEFDAFWHRFYMDRCHFRDSKRILLTCGNELTLVDLESFSKRVVLQTPELSSISNATLSGDESVIALEIAERNSEKSMNYDHRHTFQIWSTPELLAQGDPTPLLHLTS